MVESLIDLVSFFDGVNILNLCGLGVNCILILVNGWCYVGGFVGFVVVDVGLIFVKLIKLVEVFIGGVLVVYGVDVVIGVVNFILWDDYEGFEVDVNIGIFFEGDGE